MAKLCVMTTTTTDVSMTDNSVNFNSLCKGILCQSKVVIDTVIVIPISDTVGI